VRVLGLDIGQRRVGVALSDPGGTIATPHAVLDASAAIDGRSVVDLVSEWEIGLVVVGIPLSLDGGEGPQAAATREAASRLERRLGVPVVFRDERLSSAEAERRMAEAGLSEKERRNTVDMVAASIILQGYLDTHPGGAGRETSSSESLPDGEGGVDELR
jgi:putative Holliday junction resolvase